MNDVTMTALQSALRGLATRQRVIADNVANIQTPGFRAGRVEFESALAAALSDGDAPSVSATTTRSNAPTRLDGNNVNIDDETIGMLETTMRYELTVRAMSEKFALLRTAIKG
ncbi:MAG TPA: flagellar basal body protein [Egibacteraceae bacterium]|nr:flagellar basal body protein [Egibacteraceae bacterium]